MAEQLGTGLPNQLRGCNSRPSLRVFSSTCSSSERGALQTRHGPARLRSTSLATRCSRWRTALRLLSASGQVRCLPRALCRVRLQVRSLVSQASQTGAIPVRGANIYVSAGGSGGLATNEALRWFDSIQRHQMLSRADLAAALRTPRMLFDSAREHQNANILGSSKGRTRVFEARHRGSNPRPRAMPSEHSW